MEINKHDWYQNNDYVMINIFVICDDLRSVISLEDVIVSLKENELLISFKKEIENNFKYELYEKTNFVNASIKRKFIEIKLKKKENVFWKFLEKKDDIESFKIGYPSSSKKKTDWFVPKEEIEKGGVPFGEDPTSFFFKNIYKTGTDDQRRAIMKSMQESNGKVLSNNWKDVKNKKVEYKKEKE